MGWLEDHKKARQEQEEKKKEDIARAGGIFNEQETKANYSSGLADRLTTYGKLDTSTPKPVDEAAPETPKGPRTAREMLDDIKNAGKREDPLVRVSKENLSAVEGISDSYHNKGFLTEVKSDRVAMTKEEHAAAEEEISEKLGALEKSIKNVDMVTSGKEFGIKDPKAGENLSSQDINSRTAGFRNVGFFTDSERHEEKKLTEGEKTEREIEDLEKIDEMVGQFTNTEFMTKTKPDENEEGE